MRFFLDLLRLSQNKYAEMHAVKGIAQTKPILPVKALTISVAIKLKFMILIKERSFCTDNNKIKGKDEPT